MDFPGLDGLLSTGMLVHAAALLQIAGFLMRDQLALRALVLAGSGLYVAYYFLHPATPLWEAIFWSSVLAATNFGMICVIARRRRARVLDDDALRLHAAFDAIEPGDFRQLMALARTDAPAEPLPLTHLGAPATRLFYVLDGPIEIARPDRVLRREGRLFIGEIGYLLGAPATATVTLAAGGRALSWDAAELRRLAARRDPVARCIERALNRDLAAKLIA